MTVLPGPGATGPRDTAQAMLAMRSMEEHRRAPGFFRKIAQSQSAKRPGMRNAAFGEGGGEGDLAWRQWVRVRRGRDFRSARHRGRRRHRIVAPGAEDVATGRSKGSGNGFPATIWAAISAAA